MSVAFVGAAKSLAGLRAGDDAKRAEVVPLGALLSLDLAFDHRAILHDYLSFVRNDRGVRAHAAAAAHAPGEPAWVRTTCSGGDAC